MATVGRYRQVPLVGLDGGVGMLFAVSGHREQQYSTSSALERGRARQPDDRRHS